MARSVADVVLVRDDFAVVPAMVAEGRQILRNIQRVAQLFVTKSVFTAVMGLAVAIPTATFPLLPRQFTIASTITIGILAFVLALAPSTGPWRPDRFLQSVARFAIPAGLAVGAGISVGYFLARYGFDLERTSRDRGHRHRRGVRARGDTARDRAPTPAACGCGLCATMALLFLLALVVPFLRDFFQLETPTAERRRLGPWERCRCRRDAGGAAAGTRLSGSEVSRLVLISHDEHRAAGVVSDSFGDAPARARGAWPGCRRQRLPRRPPRPASPVRGPVAGNRQRPDVAAEPSLELATGSEPRVRRR